MPGWILVTALLVLATVLSAALDRPSWLVGVLAACALASGVAGALMRPDRR